MADKNQSKNKLAFSDEGHGTNFAESLELSLGTILTEQSIERLADVLAERVGIKTGEVKIELKGGNFSVTERLANIRSLFENFEKKNRHFQELKITASSRNRMNGSHKMIWLTLPVADGHDYHKQRVSIHGDTSIRNDSQNLLDWGDGSVKELKGLTVPAAAKKSELFLNLSQGTVDRNEIDNRNIREVRVVGDVKVKPETYAEAVRAPSNHIAIASILVAIILALIGWLIFGG